MENDAEYGESFWEREEFDLRKRRKTNRLWALLLTALMVIGMMPTVALAAGSYDLWVNGEQFSSDHLEIACGEGTATYDPATKTLTLEDATITERNLNSRSIDSQIGELNIILKGENKMTAYELYASQGDVTILGTGSLTVNTSTTDAIFVTKKLIVDGTTLQLTAPADGGGILAVGGVEIRNGANVTAKGQYYGISTEGNTIEIKNSTVQAEATEDYCNAITANCYNADLDEVVVGDISIIGSTVTAKSFYPALRSFNLNIADSMVEATSTGDWGIWCDDEISIRGTSKVTATGESGSMGCGAGEIGVIADTGNTFVGEDEATAEAGTPFTVEKTITRDDWNGSLFFRVETHNHDFGNDWAYDTNNHWQECECGEKQDEAAHMFGTDNICDVCGFEPTFDGDSVAFEIPVSKTVVQRGTAAPGSEIFTFKLGDDRDGNPADFGITMTNLTIETDGAGVFDGMLTGEIDPQMVSENFGWRTWDQGGHFHKSFALTEQNDVKDGWSYSEKRHGVDISYTVATGKVSVRVHEYNNDVYYPKANFINTYTKDAPETFTVTIPVKKIVELGGNAVPGSTDFSFELAPNESSAVISDLTITGNTIATNGVGEYEGTITLSGTFPETTDSVSLMLTEKNDGAKNWIYDDTRYIVIISRTQNVRMRAMTTWSYVVNLQKDMGEHWNPVEVEVAEYINAYATNIIVPIDDVPKTGDTSNMLLWTILAVVASIGITGIAVHENREKEQAE